MASLKPRVSVEYGEEATVITFTDEKILEERDIVELQESLMGVIEQAAEKINLILDFTNVKFLSSAVLGLLIRVSKKVYEQNGQLRLCNISPRIYEIFKITRLTKIFDIYPDRAAAIASFAGAQK
jgi:anti-anti-sigma factor